MHPKTNQAAATISADDGETAEALDWSNTLQEEKIIRVTSLSLPQCAQQLLGQTNQCISQTAE